MFFTTRKATTTVLLVAALIAALTTPSFADKKDDLEKQKKGVSGKIGDAKKDLRRVEQEVRQRRRRAQDRAGQARCRQVAAQQHPRRARDRQGAGRPRCRPSSRRPRPSSTQPWPGSSQGKAELRDSGGQGRAVRRTQHRAGRSGHAGVQRPAARRGPRRVLRADEPQRLRSVTPSSPRCSSSPPRGDPRSSTASRVKKLRDQVGRSAKPPRRNLVRKQQLESAAEDQAAEVDRARRRPQGCAQEAAAKIKRGRREAAQASLETERPRLESADRRARRRGAGRRTGRSATAAARCPAPVNGPITSPYGMRVHPITARLQAARRNRLRRRPAARPIHAAAGGMILEQYYNGGYGNRVILNNGLMRGQSIVTTYNHLTQLRQVGRGDKSTAASRSATSARPATRPAATCTSWSSSTATPPTRWAGSRTR